MIFRKRMMSAAMAVLMTCSMCVTSTLAEDNKRKEAQEDRVTILFPMICIPGWMNLSRTPEWLEALGV